MNETILTFASLSMLLLTPAFAAENAGPNVVIIITDDQGYGDLGCHGNPVIKTPNLDRFHAESIRLTDFHVSPMCTPTRGQLLSGLDSLRNGAMNVSSGRTFLRRGIPTIADVFAANGYRCGQFGKWHLGDNYPYRSHDRGFHESISFPSSHIGSAPDFFENCYFNDIYSHNGRREQFEGYSTDVFFDQAIEWMRVESEASRPFLCYIATAAAHAPLFVPRKYRDLYADQQPHVARFFGMIANIDENFGRLQQFLSQSGLSDNTIVIFLTDNGGTVGVSVFNSGMRGAKMDLYDGGHRVPCFFRWPNGNLRQSGDIAELTTAQDILPTLIDLCSLRASDRSDTNGTSLKPLLYGRTDQLEDRMLVVQVSHIDDPTPRKGDACILWKKWRLIFKKELYDVSHDPSQQQNLIDERPDVANKMLAHYEQWWSEIEPRVNQHSALTIGAEEENPAQLSPADWEDVFLDQGDQVRSGLRCNGPWNVIVDRDGQYEFELRRWAREADTPLASSLPLNEHADGQFRAGEALPIAQVRLKIADFDQSRSVQAMDKSVTFTADLRAGSTQLKTWFYDADGHEICGAYYVYVCRK